MPNSTRIRNAATYVILLHAFLRQAERTLEDLRRQTADDRFFGRVEEDLASHQFIGHLIGKAKSRQPVGQFLAYAQSQQQNPPNKRLG